jgi:hypothetical protein
MSVKVVCPRPTSANQVATGTDQYGEAGAVHVEQGHLLVKRRGVGSATDTVAVYAPGRWHYATTEGRDSAS